MLAYQELGKLQKGWERGTCFLMGEWLPDLNAQNEKGKKGEKKAFSPRPFSP